MLDLAAASVFPAVARHFLFSGTKIIRARKPQDGIEEEAVALAMVVRTGFNTTKGALVRSMLFPKPTGFKFYRDAFYYIAVMGGIAAIGFFASFINFIRLGVRIYLTTRSWDMTDIKTVGMESYPHQSFGSHHHCRSARASCDFDHWNEFCSLTVEEKKHLLHQSSESQYWRQA